MRVRVWHSLLIAMLWTNVAAGLQSGTITIELQEWRDEPQRHLLIQGVLNGDTRFRLLLPEKRAWRGRIIQYLQGGLGGDYQVGSLVGHDRYALAHGAAYLESSQGHVGTAAYEEDDTPEEIAYGASYAVVQYAQARCVEIYGRSPTYVYVFGDSGGGHRSSGLIERFPELYDGAVPCVGAGTFRVPWYLFSVYEHCRPLLQPKQQQLVDVCRPGSTRNPWQVVTTDEEKKALRRLLHAGFPTQVLDTIHAEPTSLVILDYNKYKLDPAYSGDFWTAPGYEGHGGVLDSHIIEGIEGTIIAVDARKRRLRIQFTEPPQSVYGLTLTFTSGKLADQWRRVYGQRKGSLQIGPVGPGIADAAIGDHVVLDNRDLLAFRFLHNHLVDPEDQALGGFPDEPATTLAQRSPDVARGVFEPDRPMGRIHGKVIAVYGSHDNLVWPSNAYRYARLVRKELGPDTEDHFRLHFVENGIHHPMPQTDRARFVGRVSLVHKALDDLMAWVEEGVAPQTGTAYTVGELNQLELPASAEERGGYQPVASIQANGNFGRHDISSGQTVTFSVSAEDPDNQLASCEIDFEGDGPYEETQTASGSRGEFVFTRTYSKPGTYYPTALVTDSTRSSGSIGKGIQNLAAMRVVVSD